MSGLKPGKYIIVLAGNHAPPSSPIGANSTGGPVAPVVVGGKNIVWLARDVGDGNYSLSLQQGGMQWLSQPSGDEVTVGIMPGPMRWAIRKHEDQENTYSIELPSPMRPTRAWTLESSKPETPVKLGIYELSRPGQLFTFIPIF